MDTSTALEASPSSSPSSSSSSSSTTSSSSPYDVFLSFGGEDTRKTFTDHLYWTMKDAGIDFFMEENESIRRGANISDKVKQIIEGSRVSVIVFSRRYADSIWCLEELVQIMECRRTLKQMVLPIFYDLSPSDVLGTYVQAFLKHRELFCDDTDKQEKIQRWADAFTEAALTESADLTVRVFRTTNGYEGIFIREIIDEITRQLKSPTPVGIAFPKLQKIDSLELQRLESYERERIDIDSLVSDAKPPLSTALFNKRCHLPDHADDMSFKFSSSGSSFDSGENLKSNIRSMESSWTNCLGVSHEYRSSADSGFSVRNLGFRENEVGESGTRSSQPGGTISRGESGSSRKRWKVRNGVVKFQAKSEVNILDDGFRWRKYGQKDLMNSPYRRAYCRCSVVGCGARKQVQREGKDPTHLNIIYKGVHNHPGL